MTQDPKKLPNWLKNQSKETPRSEPPPPSDEPDESSDVPPWLRDQPAPEEPKVKRVQPPAPTQQGDSAPWLEGLEGNKTYKIGGTELSEEYLASAEQLPDAVESEMTYDSWMAQQIESRRVKDIEEEVPDLLSDIGGVKPVVPEKTTGQLPDWFLGLEALDTTDAPEWFSADDGQPAPAAEPPEPASDDMPPWMSDMVDAVAADETPEPPAVDEIGSFFSSLHNEPIEAEAPQAASGDTPAGLPDDDWYSQLMVPGDESDADAGTSPETDTASASLPDDDWYQQLVPKANTQPPASPRRAPAPLELPDIEDLPEDEPSGENELDAFFDNVAAGRASPADEDIEEPELDWLGGSQPVDDEPTPVEPEPESETPGIPGEDTNNWLSQLENIVTSASRQTGMLSQPQQTAPLSGKDDRNATADEVGAEPAAFEWPEPEEIEPEPEPEPEEPDESSASDWLNAIAPNSEMTVRTTLPEDIPMPPVRSGLLSGRLRRSEPEPEPEPEAATPPESPADEPVASSDDLIPEHELQSGWLTDDLFGESGAETPSSVDYFADTETETPSNVDYFGSSQMPQDDESPQSDDESSYTDDDFFSLLQNNADANVLEESTHYDPYAQPDEDALSEADFMNSLGLDDEEAPTADDFYARLGMTGDEPSPAPQEAAWEVGGDDQSSLGASSLDDDDFFAQLGMEQAPAASEEDESGQWGLDGQGNADFFAQLGMEQAPAASEEDVTGQWGIDDALQEDDIFAGLNHGDESPAGQSWQGGAYDDADAQSEASRSQQDEFFESLGLNDEAAHATDSLDKTDYFAALAFETDNGGAAAASDDLFTPWDSQGSEDEVSGDELPDFFASLGAVDDAQPAMESESWGAQDEYPPANDFFASLGAEQEEAPADETEDVPDFFSSLGVEQDRQGGTDRPQAASAFDDVDSYLASLSGTGTNALPQGGEMFGQDVPLDIDSLFDQPVMPDRPASEPSIPGADEDWLKQVEASVGEVSASAIVRQKEDRPVEELSDRLKKLRQLGAEVSTETEAEESAEALSGSLGSTPFIGVSASALLGGIALTDAQQKKVDLLKALVPQVEQAQQGPLSAIDATYDSSFMGDLEDTPESRVVPEKTAAPPKPPRRRRRRRIRYRVDRLLVAVVLALAVILPFILPGFRIGNLPASKFADGSSAQVAFNRVDAVQPGDMVLIGLEYGPTAAAELDGLTGAMVRHILLRAAFPVIISSNPLGLLRAQSVFDSINDDPDFLARIDATKPLEANHDYYLIRFLPGSVIGLRAFSQDSANLLLTDIRGQATNLVVRSLSEFKLVTVITDRPEDLRAYAEQVVPLTRAPFVAAVSYGAAPLSEPYAAALGGGLLVGYADGYTYQDSLGLVSARSIDQRVRIIPSDTPTVTPTLPPATATYTPSMTYMPSRTYTPSPVPPTPTVIIGTATVISRQAVNMRSGPSTGDDVIAAVPSGTQVTALSYNEDQSWVNVRLANGQEGWISASLLSISSSLQSSLPVKAGGQSHAKRQAIDEGGATRTPRPTQVAPSATPVPSTEAATGNDAATVSAATVTAEALPSATPVPATATAVPPTATRVPPTATATEASTPEATVEVTEVAAAEPPASPSPGYRNERWYAMNLGIVASVVVIALGAVINVMRGLLRRGRRG